MSAQILVVEDERNVRRQVCGWLRREGLAVASVADPEGAVAHANLHQVTLALLSTRLSGDGGLVRDLRERHGEVAAVMMHRLSDGHGLPRLMPGVVGYLFKPLTEGELMEAVTDALAWHAAAHLRLMERTEDEEETARRSLALGEALAAPGVSSVAAVETVLVPFVHGCREVLYHARAVARWALLIGRSLGLSEPELKTLEHGAYCHDIGKLALPAALLRKRGALTTREATMARTHPAIGHDILMMAPELSDAAPTVLAAHERIDGSGYPRGLHGDAITLGARITAVADAAQTMVECRPYREPVSLSRVGAELVRLAGASFDPGVVGAWLRVAEVFDG